MAIPDEARDEADEVTYFEGQWTIGGIPAYVGMPLHAYDDRHDDFVYCEIQELTTKSIVVIFEDRFRFMFGADRPPIKLSPQLRRQLDALAAPGDPGGPQGPAPSFSSPTAGSSAEALYWRGKYEGAIEMAHILAMMDHRGERHDRD